MNDAQQNPDMFGRAIAERDQFKLVRIQTHNWGTFSGVCTLTIPQEGYLFAGPSGSGKSTLLDAHASLMTPPKWVDFNVAARDADGKDRSVVTYVRGAWSQQTGESGEYAVQYLRPETTWSAIAETYKDGNGSCVVLAQVLWIRGKSTAVSDVKKHYLVLERDFEVRELQFLPESDFDARKFKQCLPDAFSKDEYSPFQERYRRLLGIDSERALRLLHKTQSAKNLGDLNAFLRDFMLDPPETFKLAVELVSQFGELKEAHRAVVDARRQIEMLKPVQDDSVALDATRLTKNELDEISAGVDKYREQRRKVLLDEAIAQSETDLRGMEQETQRLDGVANNEFFKLRALQDQRSGQGGGLLEDLNQQVKDAEAQRDSRMVKRDVVRAACKAMGWAEPDSAVWFTQLAETASKRAHAAKGEGEDLEERKYDLRTQLKVKVEEFARARNEIEAMKRQRSNVPSRMLGVREVLSKALGIPEEKLPFAGELIEVRKEEAHWQGAIERVLNGFAQSLLVDDKYYSQVSSYLNENNIGERLIYHRVMSQVAAPRTIGPNSLNRKLNFAPGPQALWVREELKAHFDYECADTVHAFRSSNRAITKEGQVKHNVTRHEKNDRVRVDDRSRWVLGFDNAAKLSLYEAQALALVDDIQRLEADIKAVDAEAETRRDQLRHCIKLSNLTWEEVDIVSMLEKIKALNERIRAEQAAHPNLAKLDDQIAIQRTAHEKAVGSKNNYAGKVASERGQVETLRRKRDALRTELIAVALTPQQQKGLDERYAKNGDVGLDNLDSATTQVVRRISAETSDLTHAIQQLQNSMERSLADFLRNWPTEAAGLDATMASVPDFIAKLARLEADGLPKYEAKFLQLQREQSDQSLTRLATQLEHERKAIRDRMALVNDSLEGAPFNTGTHLVIDTADKMLEDVIAFKQSLKASLNNALSDDPLHSERRFEFLNALVKRLSSQESIDKTWRMLVLDVRQHVDFVARELDDAGLEVEVYRSGAGKSGGQRQKLAATCLAAALRYQLGGQDRTLPRFSTVVLDEAFDKADSEFTAMAMNIFKTFGFQMVVATPMKSVMALEPFIGGACFVHIKDRKTSLAVQIAYDHEVKRLITNEKHKDAEEAAVA